MALSRKFLSGMGLTEEQASAIIEANEETITGLKAQIEEAQTARDKAEKDLAKAQKELSGIKEAAEKEEGKNPYKVKYEAIKEEFEAYKKDISAKEVRASKREAYKALLKDCGVSDKRIDSVLKVTNLDVVELDEDGKIKDSDTLKKQIKEEWSDFIPTYAEKGADTSTPPANTGGATMTKEDIRKIADPVARQKAMAENPTLFGLSK